MSLAGLLNKDCTIVRRTTLEGSTDPFNQPTYDDYGNAIPVETLVNTRCALQQASSDEPGEEGEFSETTWDLFLPAGTAVDTGDRVLVGGAFYELLGQPWDASDGSSGVHHVEATVRRTAGQEDVS